uniref:Constitutively photomorphogenic 1 n=1 Tax=Volvox carteri f. nagariensis TaxID=3068 RepID=A0A481XTC4_VOLCA|nr:constitutively photomorphogenic 1 [Volvox carteri f. nagariensis]
MSVTTRITDDDIGRGSGHGAVLPLGLSPDDVQCPICVETIADPFVTSCGHTFCYQCISTQLKHKNSCPSCGAYLTADNIYPNFLLNKILRKAATAPPSGGVSLLDQVQRLLADNLAPPDNPPGQRARHEHHHHRHLAAGQAVVVGEVPGHLQHHQQNQHPDRGQPEATAAVVAMAAPLLPQSGAGGVGGGGDSSRRRVRLRDIDAVLEALYEAREELERRESSDALHLLLCFLQHAREHKARQMAELRQQLDCLDHDILAVAASGTPAAAAAPVTAADVAAAAAHAAAGEGGGGNGDCGDAGEAAARDEAEALARDATAAAASRRSHPHQRPLQTGTSWTSWLHRALPHLDTGDGGTAAAGHLDTDRRLEEPPLPAVAVDSAKHGTEDVGPQLQEPRPRQVHRAPLRRASWCLHTLTPAGRISSVTLDTSSLHEPGQQAEAFAAAVQHALAAATGGGAAGASTAGTASCSISVDDGDGDGGAEGTWQQPPQPAVGGEDSESAAAMAVTAVSAASAPSATGGGGEAVAEAPAVAEAAVAWGGPVTAPDQAAQRHHISGRGASGSGLYGMAVAADDRRAMPRCGSADNFMLLFSGQAAAAAAAGAAEAAMAAETEVAVASASCDAVASSGGGCEDVSTVSAAASPPRTLSAAPGPRHMLPRQQQQSAVAAEGTTGPPAAGPLRFGASAGDGDDGSGGGGGGGGGTGGRFVRDIRHRAAGEDGGGRRGESSEEDEVDVRERRRRHDRRPPPPPPPPPAHRQCPGLLGSLTGGRGGGRLMEPSAPSVPYGGDRSLPLGPAAALGGGSCAPRVVTGAVGETTAAAATPAFVLSRAGVEAVGALRHSGRDSAAACTAVAAGQQQQPPPGRLAAAAMEGPEAEGADGEQGEDLAAVHAAKRRRMLSQFDLLERCYLKMRAPGRTPTTRRVSGTGSALHPKLHPIPGTERVPNSLSLAVATAAATTGAAAATAATTAPPRPGWPGLLTFPTHLQNPLSGSQAGAGGHIGAAGACGGAHPHRVPAGPRGQCNCEGDGAHGHGDGGGGDPDLEDFSAVLAAATQYSRLELLAEIPRHGLGSAAAGAIPSGNAGGGGGGGLQILSSIEFDMSEDLFATAGVVPRILVYDYQTLLSSRHHPHHPHQPPPRPVTELTARSKLSCLSYSRGVRQHLLAADYLGGVALWDTEAGMQIQDYEAHERRVWGVDFCPHPSRHHYFASGSDDGLVKLWSTQQASSCLALELRGNVCCVEFHPHHPHLLAVGSALHCAAVYDLRQPAAPLHTLLGHRRAVSYVRWLSNRHELVTASTDNTLKLWSLSPPPPPAPSAQPVPGAPTSAAPVAAATPHQHHQHHHYQHTAHFNDPTASAAMTAATAAASGFPGVGSATSTPFPVCAELVRTFCGHVNERNFVGLATDGDYVACGSERHEVFVYHRSLPQPALRFSFAGRVHESERGGAGPPHQPHPHSPHQGPNYQQQQQPNHFVTALQWRRNSPHLLAANSAGCLWLLGLKL